MVALYRGKELNVVTIDAMEHWLVRVLGEYGIAGYTILPARGFGSSGESDITGMDTNIFLKAIVSEDVLERVLERINAKIAKGYHLTTYVNDVQVMRPEKFRLDPEKTRINRLSTDD